MIKSLILALAVTHPMPVLEVGEGDDKIDVFQTSDSSCAFVYSNHEIDSLYFNEKVDCRDIYFLTRGNL